MFCNSDASKSGYFFSLNKFNSSRAFTAWILNANFVIMDLSFDVMHRMVGGSVWCNPRDQDHVTQISDSRGVYFKACVCRATSSQLVSVALTAYTGRSRRRAL